MNLPTFKEWASSKNGCGVKYTNNFKRCSGKFLQNLEASYYAHCELLDLYAREYIHNCNHFDIDVATNAINHHANLRRKQNNRTKMR